MGKIIQFENSAVNIALVLREQFKRQDICITDEYLIDEGPVLVSSFIWRSGWVRKGAPVSIKTVYRELGSASESYQPLPGHKVEFVQTVDVLLSSPAQILAAGAAPPPGQSLKLNLIFDLRLTISTEDVFLVIAHTGIDDISEIPSPQSLRQQIASQFLPQKIPLQVGTLSGFDGKPAVVNAGIAITWDNGEGSEVDGTHRFFGSGETFVGIRIEIGEPPTSTAPWETFLAGGTSYILTVEGGRISTLFRFWNLFIDEHFLTERVKRDFEEILQTSGKFRLQGGIAASWSAPDGRPIVYLDFFGEAVNACGDLGLFVSNDINLHVQIPVEFSVLVKAASESPYTPGRIEQKTKINYWKSSWDTSGCQLGTTLAWPYLGFKLMNDGMGETLEFLGTIANGPMVSIFSLVEANKWGKVPSSGPSCVQTGDDEFVCSRPFEPDSFSGGGLMELHRRWGRADGLVLAGGSFWKERLSREFHIASVSAKQFKLNTPHFSCLQIGLASLAMLTNNPEDFVTYEAIVSVTFEANAQDPRPSDRTVTDSKTALIPPYICNVRVRPEDDPLNVFTPYVSWGQTRSPSSPQVWAIYVRVPVTKVPAAYFAAAQRYPCRLLIQTSVGTRMMTLPAMEQADGADVKSLTLNAWAQRVSECKAKSKPYNPKWKIDPADFFHERHHWHVMVAGLRPGEQVSLKDKQRRVVSVIQADHRGTAQLRAFLLPDAYDGQLSFRRTSVPAPVRLLQTINQDSDVDLNASENYIRIDVKQTQFLLQSEIETGEPFVASASITLGNRHVLLVVQPSSVTAYDISHPQQPMVVAHSALRGMSGALSTGSHILVWGNEGIVVLEINLELGEIRTDKLSEAPTVGMTSVGQQVFILSRDEVDVWDKDRHRKHLLKAPETRFLAATHTHLLIGSDSSVKIYQTLGHECPKLIGEHDIEGLSRIVASEMIGEDHHFILKGSSRSELIDVSNPEQRLVILSEYHDLPEMAYLERHRDLLIEADKSAMFLRIYSIGVTAFI